MDVNKLYSAYLDKETIRPLMEGTLEEQDRKDIIYKFNNILRILSTYIPQNIVLTKIEDPESKKHNARFIDGTMVYIDVNGFTSLTEKLSQHGNEGSEEITRIVNDFFKEMVKIIFKYKGVLVKYGGDSMMVFFSSSKDFCDQEHPLAAASCAFSILKKTKLFSPFKSKFGEFPFSVTIAIHSDNFFESCVGKEDYHIEYFITGKGVEETALIEEQSGHNEIVTDKETFNRIKSRVVKHREKNNYVLLEDFKILEKPEIDGSLVKIDFEDINELLNRINNLKPFLIQGLYEKISSSWKKINLEGEYRHVTVLFLNFYFTKDIFSDFGKNKESEIGSILNSYFTMIQDVVYEFDGSINKIDMYSLGSKIIITFGFPRSHFDDEQRGVKCAYAIMEKAERFSKMEYSECNFSIKQRIGINSGYIFCGNVGSPFRKEYTIMGDTVNLSARIMASSRENEIWISDNVYKKASNVVRIKSSEEKTFKGKAEKILIHLVSGIVKKTVETEEIFVGRKEEIKKIVDLFDKSQNSFASIQIIGSVGLGKSAVLREFLKTIRTRHEILLGRGIPYGKNIQYNAIKEILVRFFGITGKDNEEIIKQKINTYINYLKLEHLSYNVPLIGTLLSDGYKGSPALEIEDMIVKKELLFSIFTALLEARSKISPIVFIIEDGEWLDTNSMELITHLIKKELKNIFIIIVSRKQIILTKNTVNINMIEFDEKETNEFIEKYPLSEKLDEKMKWAIYEKSKGVPYFILEILNSLKDSKNVEIPDSIYKSVFSRMDLLGEKHKEIIKNASVIGVEFSTGILFQLLSGLKDEEKILDRLIEEDFLIKKDDENYVFRNMLVQEVAYNSLSVSKKKQLHMDIGYLYEKDSVLFSNYEILSNHFEKAEIFEKAIYYYFKSGEKAFNLNNYNKAVQYYDKSISLILNINKNDVIQKIEIDALKKIGKIHLILEDVDNAYESYNKALELSKKFSFSSDIADCLINIGLIKLNKLEYDIALSCFDESLKFYNEINDYNGLASCYLNIGLINKLFGSIDKAYSNYEKALEYYEKCNNNSGSADVYNNLGNLSKELSKFDDAIKNYEKAVDVFEKIKNEVGLASVYNNIGTLYNTKGESENSIKYFSKSLEIEQTIGNEKGKAVCYNNLGNTYIRTGDWKKALENFSKGLQIAYDIKDNKEIANIYLNSGVMYIYKNDFDKAKSSLKSALHIYNIIRDNKGLYSTSYNLALIYQKENDFDLAREYLFKAFDIANQFDEQNFASSALNISKILFNNKLSADAKECVLKGIERISKKDIDLLHELYGLVSRIYKFEKDYYNAIHYLKKSIEIKEANEYKKSAAYSHLQLALLYVENKEIKKARSEFSIAEDFFKKSNDILGKLFCYNKLAYINYKEKNYPEAIKYYEQNIENFMIIGADLLVAANYKKIATIYYEIKDLNLSIQFFSKALEKEKELGSKLTGETYYLIGMVFIELNDYDNAIENFEKCYESEFDIPEISKVELAYKIGVLYKLKEKYASSIIYFERCAVNTNKGIGFDALKELAILYEKIGQKERLRYVLNKLIMHENDEDKKRLIADCIAHF